MRGLIIAGLAVGLCAVTSTLGNAAEHKHKWWMMVTADATCEPIAEVARRTGAGNIDTPWEFRRALAAHPEMFGVPVENVIRNVKTNEVTTVLLTYYVNGEQINNMFFSNKADCEDSLKTLQSK